MKNLLLDPVFQSGVLPVLVSLLAIGAFQRLNQNWTGMGFTLSFFCSAILFMGIDYFLVFDWKMLLVAVGMATVLAYLYAANKIPDNKILKLCLLPLVLSLIIVLFFWELYELKLYEAFEMGELYISILWASPALILPMCYGIWLSHFHKENVQSRTIPLTLWYLLLMVMCLVYMLSIETTPFDSKRKILFFGIVAIGAGLALDHFKLKIQWRIIIMAVTTTSLTLFLLWPVFEQNTDQAYLWTLLTLLPALLYTGWLTASNPSIQHQPLNSVAVVTMLGFTIGICAFFGSSLVNFQIGITAACAASGYGLWLIAKKKAPENLGMQFYYPAMMILGLTGLSAVYFALLPWYCLIPSLLFPIVFWLPDQNWTKSKQILVLAALTIPVSATSIGLAWFMAETTSY